MRKLLRYLPILLVIPYLLLVAFAHPGRTDSRGGHTDHSTGEYHYHHGYSAHDHYDMDGDGIKDCPYDFNDKTEHHSGSTSTTYKTSKEQANDVKKEKESSVDFLSIIFALSVIIGLNVLTYYLSYVIESTGKSMFWLCLSLTILSLCFVALGWLNQVNP